MPYCSCFLPTFLECSLQDFPAFKANNLIYVDKTELIHRLIDDGSSYFLCRNQALRFGFARTSSRHFGKYFFMGNNSPNTTSYTSKQENQVRTT
ncbi:MAG: hypothetical protein D3910_20220 [Candidatus Electrothrix sp. ATG2]|nr:hypothetical protein [Candidatus Electrothrix sp. ATG2]